VSRLLVRGAAPEASGRLTTVTPESAGWRYVGFEAFRLAPGARLRRHFADRETCIVVLSGSCDMATDAGDWRDVGERATPFDGPPAGAYLPPGLEFEIVARAGVSELAIGHAPATRGAAARVLRPSDARLEIRGSGAMERRIHHILMDEAPAESLLVTEVVTPGGHWSSYPPHKHDTNDPPRETALEEVYYHRLRGGRGFAVQRVYTTDRSLDECISVTDGDVVLVPRGFHTVSAPPGYDNYYLNVMAGPLRAWNVTFDPDHAWLRS
jgi:5-deoxy-glucuronate isomerase